jgi:probable HAF family extracellular repeat protein
MKPILTSIAASSLLAALAIAQPPPHYTVTDLGTLGGKYSFALGINSAGWVTGGAATSTQTGGLNQTAFLWYGAGPLIDLGTLGGPACPACNSSGGGPNGSGEVAITSETSETDPNGEDFCEFGTHRQCLGAIWKNGTMTALPTLPGGNNANAFGLNNRGQVVGFAENGTRDSTCLTGGTPFQVIQFEAVIWEPNGEVRELPPLKGDTVGFAFGINDSGQVVGSSGLCSNTAIPTSPNAPHAVLWEKDGSAIDLGNLGGTGNIASSVNNRGEVVGGAQSSKDGTGHPFLWTKETGMQDLGTFPGAVVTVPPCCNTINDRGQVVGFSIDGSGNMRAFLWQPAETTATASAPNTCPALTGTLMDLNTLIPADSGWYLQAAESINDAGEIVGNGLINGDFHVHAFLATPAPAPPTKASAAPKNATVTARQFTLDGTASISADGKPLSYLWSIPQGSPSAAILQGTTATPTVQFVAPGVYMFQLTVRDSIGTSASDVATVNFQGH